jgi:hypothetical protein
VDAGGNDIYGVDWNSDGSVYGFGNKGGNVKIYNGTHGYFDQYIETLTDYTDGKELYSVDFSYDS